MSYCSCLQINHCNVFLPECFWTNIVYTTVIFLSIIVFFLHNMGLNWHLQCNLLYTGHTKCITLSEMTVILFVLGLFLWIFVAIDIGMKRIHTLLVMESSLSYIPSYVTLQRPYQYSARYDVRQIEYNYGNKIKVLHQQCVAQTNEWSIFTYLKDVVYRWFSGSPSCDEVMNWVDKPTNIMNQADVND